MEREELIKLICQLFNRGIKGKLTIDFSGNGEQAKIRFTNISLDDVCKMKDTLLDEEHIDY